LTGGSSASSTIADKDLASIVGDMAIVKITVEISQGQRAGSELPKNQADQAVEAVDAVVYEAAWLPIMAGYACSSRNH